MLLKRLSNQDGLAGGLANLIRYLAGGVYVGPTDFSDGQRAISVLNDATRSLLDWAGLTNAGINPRFPDKTLFLAQSGMEELSGFGPMGTFALGTMLCAACCWRQTAVWWQLGIAGLLGLILVSLTVGYNSWANRYLITWYAFGCLAFACALWETKRAGRRAMQWGCFLLAAVSAVSAPGLSFNRGPASIATALYDREQLETSAFPVLGRVRERLRELRSQSPQARIFLVVNDESAVLPLLEDRDLAVIMTRESIFRGLALKGSASAGDLVVRESPVEWRFLKLAEIVTAPNLFSFDQTVTYYIYRVTTSSRKID